MVIKKVLAMKNIKYKYLFFFLIIFYSCNKKCHEPTQNRFNDKLKQFITYKSSSDSINTLTRLIFTYDSSTLDLIKINIGIKANGIYIDTFGYVTFKKIDNNKTLFSYNDIGHFKPEMYIIKHNNKQVCYIAETDDTLLLETIVTKKNSLNNEVDTISDNGLAFVTGVSIYDFNYLNGNCISYNTKCTYQLTNPIPYTLISADTLEYTTNYNNNDALPFQCIGISSLNEYSSFSYFNKVMYYASFYGFYFANKSKNLISKIYANNNSFIFNYEFHNNKVIKVSTLNNNTTGIIDLIYY